VIALKQPRRSQTAKRRGIFIVKVQLSLFTSHDVRQVMVYNEDRSILWMGPADEDVGKLMGDAVKRFFYAELVNTEIVIDDKRPCKDQEW
jgi:hypothetical protein